MTYLLDTDTISHALRPRPQPELLRRLDSTPAEQLFTSTITLGELLYGVFRGTQPRDLLLRRIERLLESTFTILHYDPRAARIYAQLRADLERAGTPIGMADTQIAAIALSRDLIVITANMRHFERVQGLTVENWLEPEGRR